MPRIYRTQKEVEKLLIPKFVRGMLGYTISRPYWGESPDAVLTLRKGRTRKRVAIEHTSYHRGVEAGQCSPQTPVADFWKRVLTSLARRIGQRKHLAAVQGRVWLNTKQFRGQPDSQTREASARQFAKELVDFLEHHPVPESEFVRYPPLYARPSVDVFSGYPTLRSLVSAMMLYRTPGAVKFSRCGWECDSVSGGGIGLNVDSIRSAIQKKNEKARKYTWRSATEKWLLIVAQAFTSRESAGTPREHEWVDADLSALCQASPFDRIYFWEYPRSWYKSLKPNRPDRRHERGMKPPYIISTVPSESGRRTRWPPGKELSYRTSITT